MILLIGFVCSGCDEKTFSTSDANTYLKEKSEFNENIKNYLPSYEELKDAKIVFYTSYNNYEKEEALSKSMICMTVEYGAEDFKKARKKMEQLSEEFESSTMSSSFYCDGVLYNGFIIINNDYFVNNGYCAIAYSVCSDAQTLSYIAFDSYDLQFMNVQSALELFPDFKCGRQIVSY